MCVVHDVLYPDIGSIGMHSIIIVGNITIYLPGQLMEWTDYLERYLVDDFKRFLA